MADRPTLYLLDASYYIFRAYHSTAPREGRPHTMSTSSGMPTNALLVFTSMLRKLCRDHEPSHFAAVFETAKTFRNEIFHEYKAHRPPIPDDLRVQLPFFRPIVKGLGLGMVEVDGFEADDVIASMAVQGRAAGYEPVIVSADKDLYQVLTGGIRMYDGMRDRWIDREVVEKKFGVGPEKVAEVQALMGDATDNIPGIQGIGPKTASKLITEYGNLEGVYEHVGALKGKLRERIEAGKDDAFMSRTLCLLRTDVALPTAFDALKLRSADPGELVPIFTQLEFKTLLRDYKTVDVTSAEWTETPVTTPEALTEMATALSKAETIAIELLPDTHRTVRAAPVGLALAAGSRCWYVPVGHAYLGAPSQLPLATVLDAVRGPLTDPDKKQIVCGGKELYVVLRSAGLDLPPPELDVELGSYLLAATRYAHNLENIALDRLGRKLPPVPRDVARGRETWDTVPVDSASKVALSRVQAAYELAADMLAELEKAGLSELHRNLEIPLSRVLAQMEIAGIRVDPGVLARLSADFGKTMNSVEKDCHSLAGTPFNLGSPRQLADVLFNRLGLPVGKTTKTGPSTDASVLEQLADRHPLVPKIFEWREVQKLKGTYTDVLPGLVNPATGRIHTNFRQAVAATGRLSSFEPNLQNIPIRTELGRQIRDAFVPGEGCVLLSADYSQVELRVLGHLSGDPGLISAFEAKKDVHRQTASEIFGTPESDVTYEQRSAAKAINFGLMYGMGAFRLARDLGISRPMAQDYIDRYFERFSRVRQFIDDTLESGRDLGYVSTILGRRRYVPELTAKNHTLRAAAERAAINMPVQGSAADLIKLAMLRVQAALAEQNLQSRMLLQVHDELVFDVPHAEIEIMTALVRELMEGVYELRVPLTVSVAHGMNWNEAH